MVTVVELRHVFGCLFTEKGTVGLKDELEIFNRVQKLINASYPLFRIKLIVCGLKVLPSPDREN